MWGNKGFTLLEMVVAVALISLILLVIASMILTYTNSWDYLRDSGERDYALRTISTFFHKEVKLMDLDKEIYVDNNNINRGNRLNYSVKNSTTKSYIDSLHAASSGLISLRNHDGTRSITIADNVSFIHFTVDDDFLHIVFRIKGEEYGMVIPWQ